MFATYIPGARSTGSACQASSGTSRFYLMSVVDGRPVRNFDGLGTDDPTTKDVDESLTTADRYDELNQGGLPPNPTILFAATTGTLPDKPIVCVGSECLDPGFTIASEKTYWIRRQ